MIIINMPSIFLILWHLEGKFSHVSGEKFTLWISKAFYSTGLRSGFADGLRRELSRTVDLLICYEGVEELRVRQILQSQSLITINKIPPGNQTPHFCTTLKKHQ
jgi:hypothetical protein